MLHFGKKTPEREEWWAVSDQTGDVFGPFDPGTVWFETPLHVRGGDLLRLQRVADLILNEAHAGWERLQRALAFMQPNGAAVYRRFMESGVLPRQTPALGLAGGLDVPGYLGDGAATGTAGLHTDDSKNGTSLSGFRGGSTASTIPDLSGGGPGGGHPGTLTNRNGGGGSYGARGSGSSSTHGSPGEIVGVGGVWEALRRNIFSRETIGFGSGGAGGTPHSGRGGNDGDGGSGGGAYIQIANGVLTTDSRNLNGFSGSDGTGGEMGALEREVFG